VEKRVEKVFKPKPGDVVIDIGAFLGRYTLLASKAVKNSGLVIAVEPNPLALKVLIKNIRVNGLHNIKVIRSACWSQNNILLSFDIISSYLPYGTASLVKVLSRDRINVKTSTLDSLMSHLGLRKVDWIKIDVEGAEYEVLKGAIKTLTLNRDIKVIVEVHEKNLKNPLCSFLRNLGFNIKWLDPYHLIAYRAYVQDSLTSE
jgi:FkbM family methyltransferase